MLLLKVILLYFEMDFYCLCCYVVKFVLVEIGDTVPKGTNFPEYNFFQVPKIILSGDPLYNILETALRRTYLKFLCWW